MSSKTYNEQQQAALLVWLEKECPQSRVDEIQSVGPFFGDFEAERAALQVRARKHFPDIDEDSIDAEVHRHLAD